MTSQNAGSMFEGMTYTVAMPIASPKRDSWKIIFQFMWHSPICRGSRGVYPRKSGKSFPLVEMVLSNLARNGDLVASASRGRRSS
jgi:hypothetical protein